MIIYDNHKWSFTVKLVVKILEPIGFVPLLDCKNEALLSSLPWVFISPPGLTCRARPYKQLSDLTNPVRQSGLVIAEEWNVLVNSGNRADQ